jgi:hypothetical protein
MAKLAIYRFGEIAHSLSGGQPPLKQAMQEALGKIVRRTDRLTQLALIGSFRCRGNQPLPQNTGIYLSSIFGARSNTALVLGEIYREGNRPGPLTFINTVGNAACFYLAEQLNLNSCNQFLARDDFALEGVLRLASLDLAAGNIDAALVGVACEGSAEGALAEGSHWFLVATERKGEVPLATIEQLHEPLCETELTEKVLALEQSSPETTVLVFGTKVPQPIREAVLQKIKIKERSFIAEGQRHELPAAAQLTGFLAAKNSGEKRLVHLDSDGRGHWSLLVISA